jgi:hypothetical protein
MPRELGHCLEERNIRRKMRRQHPSSNPVTTIPFLTTTWSEREDRRKRRDLFKPRSHEFEDGSVDLTERPNCNETVDKLQPEFIGSTDEDLTPAVRCCGMSKPMRIWVVQCVAAARRREVGRGSEPYLRLCEVVLCGIAWDFFNLIVNTSMRGRGQRI